MKVEDVKPEWIDAFMHAFYRSGPGMIDTVSQSLTAVIPAIQAEALERAAVALNEMADFEADGRAVIALRGAAVVLRALKEGT